MKREILDRWLRNEGYDIINVIVALNTSEEQSEKYGEGDPLWEVCGSFKREKENCNDIDIVALAGYNYKHTGKFTIEGDDIDYQIFCVASREEFSACKLYATGDKNFNTLMARIAKEKGYRLDRYGLWYEGKKVSSDEYTIQRKVLGETFKPSRRIGKRLWKHFGIFMKNSKL